MKSARDRLILALDVPTRAQALSLTDELLPFIGMVKVGLQLFTAEGPDLVCALRDNGVRVFLDLKLYDIPNTVARAVEAAARLDVQMLTLHLSGGREMIAAATNAAPAGLLLLGVTVLTSANDETLRELGLKEGVAAQVARLAKLGEQAGLRGFVASPLELAALRQILAQDAQLVIPGIRPSGSDAGDQKRTMTPAKAVAAGADYLVVGRPIRAAEDQKAAARKIIEELES
ncbi:MAG: orotidine-5'-phosphate decarboxylase [Verrucomicrobiota bacterium]